jgi:hypothetical protein
MLFTDGASFHVDESVSRYTIGSGLQRYVPDTPKTNMLCRLLYDRVAEPSEKKRKETPSAIYIDILKCLLCHKLKILKLKNKLHLFPNRAGPCPISVVKFYVPFLLGFQIDGLEEADV